MHKTLVQTLCAAFCAILSATSLGGGGMMVGARTAAWAKSDGWVNPYVTDGLIAMWDGEWNAGGGVHDPNATVWKDLVGSVDIVGIGPKADVLDRGIKVKYAAGPLTSNNNSLRGRIVTAEVSFSGLTKNEGGFCWFATASSDALYSFNEMFFSPGGARFGGKSYSKDDFVDSGFYVARYDTSAVSYSLNGTSYELTVSQWNPLRAEANVMVNGVNESWHFGDATIHSIRLYDRQLDENEKRVNDSIDKARFNLT